MLDTHHHFWQVARADYCWMTPDLAPLLRDFGPDDLAPLLRRAGMARTILVQAAETEAETDFLLGLAAQTDVVAGVVGWLDMTAADFPQRLAYYRAQPKWLGLRPMLQDHDEGFILQPAVLDNLRHVADQGVAFDILTHPRHLPNVITALKTVPHLRGVLDHISKPRIADGTLDPWRDHVAELAEMPNISCKISGMVTEAAADWAPDDFRPYVAHITKVFGPKRLMFGSDWPVCTLAASYAEVVMLARMLLSEHFGPQNLADIFGGNGARFYGVADER